MTAILGTKRSRRGKRVVVPSPPAVFTGLYFAHGIIPFRVERVVVIWPCRVPVVPGGDSASTAPIEERTARCGHRTDVMVGAVPTCGHHLADVFRLAEQRPHGPLPECWELA